MFLNEFVSLLYKSTPVPNRPSHILSSLSIKIDHMLSECIESEFAGSPLKKLNICSPEYKTLSPPAKVPKYKLLSLSSLIQVITSVEIEAGPELE